jgi:nickel-type superoxide dismutase maturation protease
MRSFGRQKAKTLRGTQHRDHPLTVVRERQAYSLSLAFCFAMELPEVTLKERLMLLFGRRRLLKVEGDSMLPTLTSGDIVVIDPGANAVEGDIVVANHPYIRSVRLVKRVERIDDRGRYVLKGDNPKSSTDSRTYGGIANIDITGKVVCKYKA